MPRDVAPADYPGCPITVTDAIAEGRVLRPPRWGLWDVMWTVLLWAGIGLASIGVLSWLNMPMGITIIVGSMAPWLGLAGWPLLTTWWRGNGPRIDLGLRLTWGDCGWGVVAGAAGLLLAGIAAIITLQFAPDLTSSAADAAKEIAESSTGPSLTVFALVVMVGAPIVEELFFRGLFFAALRKRGVSTVITVIITGVVFAAFHFEPTRFLVLLPTGLLLGWVRARTGSTGAAMLGHGIVNAPGAIALLLGLPGMSP